MLGDFRSSIVHTRMCCTLPFTHGFGLTIAGCHRKIRASKPTELDQTYLHCAPDDPILEVEQVGFLNNGVPFEYSFSRHRYDKFVFATVNIRRNK